MEPAKTGAERQAAFRARQAEQQATEVRGIFAHPDDHQAVKDAAAKINRRRARATKRASVGVPNGFTLIELLIVVAILGILAAVIVPAWNSRNDPTETLKTKDWQCLKEEERTYTYPMMVGKVTIMQTGRRMECVEWRRVAG